MSADGNISRYRERASRKKLRARARALSARLAAAATAAVTVVAPVHGTCIFVLSREHVGETLENLGISEDQEIT